ncbi:copper-transporting ATPase RAN1-like [Olea europaea var. sylvestris]|uniref:copper-transporting ATPase RAN1-like n=1 Tax=Olea europaea var. sylvestris TaxID=158386 RepID=UPI000C1D83DC|nr:copper-transporting ATPase RAN1-like [Olea europaea var. sylvestris]
MAPSMKNLQLTASAVKGSPEYAGEEERLLGGDDVENYVEVPEKFRRIQVSVTGMTCAACSNSVESALMSIPGVVKASVALLQNKADVSFDPILVKDSFLILDLLKLSLLFNFLVVS